MAEKIPRLIAEAYGDKFDSKELAHKKLTEAITLITNTITKIDLLRQRFAEDKKNKGILDNLLTLYQTQKAKVLNLRKAWQRVFADYDKKEPVKEDKDEIEEFEEQPAPSIVQLGYIEKVNGSAIIRLV